MKAILLQITLLHLQYSSPTLSRKKRLYKVFKGVLSVEKINNFEGISAFYVAQQQDDQYYSVSSVRFMFARTFIFFFFFQNVYTGAFWKFDYGNANYISSGESPKTLS